MNLKSLLKRFNVAYILAVLAVLFDNVPPGG